MQAARTVETYVTRKAAAGNRAADIAVLLRLHAAGFEGLVFVIGPLLGGWRGQLWTFISLWSLGVIVNCYIFVLNDYVDLPQDQANPNKSRRPLVGGRLSSRTALGMSLAFPLAALMISIASGWPAASELTFATALIAGFYVNIYQKVVRYPLIIDAIHAAAMACPLPICSFAVVHRVTSLTWAVTAALFFLALQLNSVAGNLKDLEPDRKVGFRTVALTFGARVSPDGTLHAGTRYYRYCWSLQSLLMLALTVALIYALEQRPAWVVVLAAISALVAFTAASLDLRRLLNGTRTPSVTGRELYFAAGFAILLIIVALRSHPEIFFMAVGLAVAWSGSFALYEQAHLRSLDPVTCR